MKRIKKKRGGGGKDPGQKKGKLEMECLFTPTLEEDEEVGNSEKGKSGRALMAMEVLFPPGPSFQFHFFFSPNFFFSNSFSKKFQHPFPKTANSPYWLERDWEWRDDVRMTGKKKRERGKILVKNSGIGKFFWKIGVGILTWSFWGNGWKDVNGSENGENVSLEKMVGFFFSMN